MKPQGMRIRCSRYSTAWKAGIAENMETRKTRDVAPVGTATFVVIRSAIITVRAGWSGETFRSYRER